MKPLYRFEEVTDFPALHAAPDPSIYGQVIKDTGTLQVRFDGVFSVWEGVKLILTSKDSKDVRRCL